MSDAASHGWAVMDRGWEDIQKRTFTKWMNSHLRKKSREIADIVEDLGTSDYLSVLMQVLYSVPPRKLNLKAKMRLQQINNLVMQLAMMKEAGVPNKGCSAENIMDKDRKLILGLVWVTILHYQIAGISVEELTAKEGLLLWCKRVTKPYDEVNVENFTTSWKSGLALAALIHAHRPDLMNWEEIKGKTPAEITEEAMATAEEHCGIPRLLDVGDLVDVARPDERSVMTQVSEYFHAFASLSKAKTAGRRVGRFVDIVKSIRDMIREYETRAGEMNEWMESCIEAHNARDFDDSFEGSVKLLTDLKQWKKADKRQHIGEKSELEALFSNINTKLRSNNRPPYVAPEGLEAAAIESRWSDVVVAEKDRLHALNDHFKAMKDQLAHAYADIAESLNSEIEGFMSELTSLEGELEDQKAGAQAILDKVSELSLDDLNEKQSLCDSAGVESSEYTDLMVDDIEFLLDQARKALQAKISFIDNQIAMSSLADLTEEQMAEFEQTFRQFDKDGSNTLDKLEFKAGLSAQGEAYDDDEFEELFKNVSSDGTIITFEEYISYMVKVAQDSGSEEQIRESFAILAGGKDFITEGDLRVGGLDDECIALLKEEMPVIGEDQYDYKGYLDTAFAS